MYKSEIRDLINKKKYSDALRKLLLISSKEELHSIEDRWFVNYELGLVNKKLGNISISKYYIRTALKTINEQGDLYEFYRVETYLTKWLEIEINKENLSTKTLHRKYKSIYRLFKEFDKDNIYRMAIEGNIAIIEKDYNKLNNLYALACANNYFDLSVDIYNEMKKLRKEAI